MKRINLALKMAARFLTRFELPAWVKAGTVPLRGGAHGPQYQPAGQFSGHRAGCRVRVVCFSTATTEGSATTAWIKGLRVRSLPAVLKKVRANLSALVRERLAVGLVWCLVPCKGRFCSARIALPHRRPHAARLTLTRLMLAAAGLVLQGMGRAFIGQAQR